MRCYYLIYICKFMKIIYTKNYFHKFFPIFLRLKVLPIQYLHVSEL